MEDVEQREGAEKEGVSMKRWISFKQYHPIVWALLGGTIFARGASYMALPFLALYLSRTEGVHPVLIGLIIGIGPLTGTLAGFVGGHLSDKFGRKVVMLSAIFIWAGVFIGFAHAEHIAAFFILNAVNGICRAFFEPTSQALMADVTEKEKRMRVFSMRYTAINVGAAVGPLLGAYFGTASSTVTFQVTGIFYLLYGAVLAALLTKYQIQRQGQEKKLTTIKEALDIVVKDVALRYFILGGILVNIGYSQLESTLPQHVGGILEDGVVLYSVLLSVNAVTVVVLQIPLSRMVEKQKTMSVMMLGSAFSAVGFIGFAASSSWAGFIVAMLLLTIGEIFLFPSTSVFIDQIAPEEMRGTYFGAAQFRSIGYSAGPIMGGWVLSQYSGHWLFALMAAVVAGSIYFYVLGSQRQKYAIQKARAL